MDTSTVIGIAISLFSVLIAIIFAITAFHFSNKSDNTLTSIQTEINTLRSDFMKLFHQAQTNYHEITMMVVQAKVHKGEWSSEEADDFEEELEEAIQESQQLSFDPASVLSQQSKVGKNEEHG